VEGRVNAPRDLALVAMGVRIRLLAEGAALLEDARALLVGDLHLGRDTARQRAGLALPSGSDADDVTRLERLVERVGPSRLVLLGDVVHARSAYGPALSRQLRRLGELAGVRVEALPGNHDRTLDRLAEGTGLHVRPRRVRLAGAELTHAPRLRPPRSGAPLRICAHLHPAVRLREGRATLRAPAFVLDAAQVVLPAFGATTAGAAVPPRPGRRRFACTGTGVIEVPADA
jgi:DNA ligase-associated metallophosphoesterase